MGWYRYAQVTTNKTALRTELAALLAADLETLEKAHRATREGVTHEDAKPENDKDTRALEQSYLELPDDFDFGYFNAVEELQPKDLAEAGGKILFKASDGLTAPRLWISDGRPESTAPFRSLCPPGACGLPDAGSPLVQIGRKVFFPGDPGHWSTDGTLAGNTSKLEFAFRDARLELLNQVPCELSDEQRHRLRQIGHRLNMVVTRHGEAYGIGPEAKLALEAFGWSLLDPL